MEGADGGIVASAHIATRSVAAVQAHLRNGDRDGAAAAWEAVCHLPLLLFAEPSPAPIKHWLWRTGLIDSPEVRLPMLPVSEQLAARIGQEVERLQADASPAA